VQRELVSRSLEETLAIGARLGALLEPGDFVVLEGPLGAGKSRFAEGIARGLEIAERIPSPTFTIVNEHEGRHLLVHADFYRLTVPDELDELGWRDYAARGAVFVVEWLSKIGAGAPADRVLITLAGDAEDPRALTLESSGPRSDALLLALAA
jgi:tRNA threonylcarbamoyladenosine biosynthesis protein TsaE